MKITKNRSITKSNILEILHSDLQGYEIRVIDHTDNSLIGIQGHILKESKSMLYLTIIGETVKNVMIEKRNGKYLFLTDHLKFEVEGHLLEGLVNRRKRRKKRNW